MASWTPGGVSRFFSNAQPRVTSSAQSRQPRATPAHNVHAVQRPSLDTGRAQRRAAYERRDFIPAHPSASRFGTELVVTDATAAPPSVVAPHPRATQTALVPLSRPATEIASIPDHAKHTNVVTKTTVAPRLLCSKTGDVYPEKWDDACWWCAHAFSGRPVGIPTQVRRSRQEAEYHLHGFYCSWNCAAAGLQNGVQNQTIKLNSRAELYALWRLIHRDSDETTAPSHATTTHLHPAPHFSMLKKFGGSMTIEEYRAAFNVRHYCFPQFMRMIPQGYDMHSIGKLTDDVVAARAAREKLRRWRRETSVTGLTAAVPPRAASKKTAKRKPVRKEESAAAHPKRRKQTTVLKEAEKNKAATMPVVDDTPMPGIYMRRSRADMRTERAVGIATKKRNSRRKTGPINIAEDMDHDRTAVQASVPTETPSQARQRRDLCARYKQNNLIDMLNMSTLTDKS